MFQRVRHGGPVTSSSARLSDPAKSAYPGRLARRAPMKLLEPRNTKPANEGGPVSRQAGEMSDLSNPHIPEISIR